MTLILPLAGGALFVVGRHHGAVFFRTGVLAHAASARRVGVSAVCFDLRVGCLSCHFEA
ncbi:hypothetical protein predicted by Glimmer/Critica [Acetobacter ghanensis]|uniref:Uncharacterized protein n=1 Tax=Acetobacter ghanensis TaxID=431306 RepID=A0A0U5FZW4_9PROT|nr:hypothetical protein predicted by Glimmer/Critica [Acetobacter ghanensis]